MLKVRDIFDIAVVDSVAPAQFRDSLHHVAHLKSTIAERVSAIPAEFFRQQIGELAIADKWQSTADVCLERMREIAENIPARSDTGPSGS